MTDSTVVDLLRHGEVLGGRYYRGITDDALTETGWQQMQQRIAKMNHWNLIVSSPLQRCYAFADKLSKQRAIPLLVDQGFQEINFGSWEGKTAEQIEALEQGSLMRFYQDPICYPPPESESMFDFRERIQHSWQQLLTLHQGKHILLITHAGVIQALFSLLLNIPIQNSFAIQITHASLSRFQCFHGEAAFVQLNGLYNE